MKDTVIRLSKDVWYNLDLFVSNVKQIISNKIRDVIKNVLIYFDDNQYLVTFLKNMIIMLNNIIIISYNI
jgi:hypothetical protein